MVHWRAEYRAGGFLRVGILFFDAVQSRLSAASGLVGSALQYLLRELEHWEKYPIPLEKRLYAWRHGFMSRDYVLLNLDDNDPDDYLSSLQQAKNITPAVNPEYADVLENKVAFHLSTEPHVDAVTDFYGVVRNGTFVPNSDHCAEDSLPSLVDVEGDVIVKPTTGTNGRSVYRISRDADGYRVNGERVSEAELTDMVRELDGFMVGEFVENHEYADAIFPSSVNTIRILTVRDPDSGEFFVASAVHRFGNESTGPTDNWSGGGFAAPVDVETGEFGPLYTYSPDTGLRQLDSHPDTGTRVRGESVPEWERVKSATLDIAELHEQNPYAGWDVVLTSDGPVILEGNCAPHLALQQLESGLLEDDRVRRFVESL